VDGGYRGPDLAEWVRRESPELEVEVIKRGDGVQGFQGLSERCTVQHTFGWMVKNRQVGRDRETA